MHVCRALCASTTDWTTPWAADLVQATKGRGQSATQTQLKQIQEAIAELEAAGGEPNPVSSPLICSSWELLYTSKSKFDIRNPLGKRVDGSKPGIEGLFGALFGEDSKTAKALTDAASSSPIQRTVTSIDGLIVSQDIVLSGRDPRVDQVRAQSTKTNPQCTMPACPSHIVIPVAACYHRCIPTVGLSSTSVLSPPCRLLSTSPARDLQQGRIFTAERVSVDVSRLNIGQSSHVQRL